MIRNPAKLREPSKEEGIISSTDLKSVCSQEVITNLRYTQSLLNVPNGDLVAVKLMHRMSKQMDKAARHHLIHGPGVADHWSIWAPGVDDDKQGVYASEKINWGSMKEVNRGLQQHV
ncbi:hypothetical protein TNCV_734491 [Trichonephila clavipes]|nr:hypothetical protein TNCV_734491 [Trichonephila clavipes]